jgi:hypothetical protein
MEEEYRMQKAQVDINVVADDGATAVAVNGSVRDSGVGTFESGGGGADDDASTRAVASPAGKNSELSASVPSIPTIRISTESDREKDVDEEPDGEPNGEADAAAENMTAAAETLGKPEQAATQEEGDDAAGETATLNGGEAFSFTNKRLCERWLDNLFMVLYEVREPPMSVLGAMSDDLHRR